MNTILLWALFAPLLGSLLIQLYYILIVHTKLRGFAVSDKITRSKKTVSVIICARNEEENLKNNLPVILEQNHSNFEVVLVNDCSYDDSEEVLKELEQKYKHLKVVTIKEHDRYKHGKKFAVTLGIKAASNEHLIFTDADCKPASKNWLLRMQQNFSKDTEIVLGYSPYEKLGGFLNNLIRFETFYTALNYLSFALKGDPYMGVGRNLAYTKSLFFQSKGFASHMHIPSGDDDLFVNENANAENTKIEIHPEAQVWSSPKKTFSAFISQKIRHRRAGKAYKKKHKRTLAVQAIAGILFYASLISLFCLKAHWEIIGGIYLFRLLVQLITYYPIFKKLSCKDLFFWFPAFDLIYFFYILALYIITLFKKKVQWR